ncbi:PhoD-like phosphatase-domain-containing protein [Lineolata rhizophorae]|uniref:PhoD-like phosphatase-domain-containing protein n=1 Tax=Lineolata rhizophorae TaxID=578093 RepID=A0A6A6PDZ4_9PEZI|nr:PhoD-like phosphatase-domain-containing protein [Lineolata rhizophorae]
MKLSSVSIALHAAAARASWAGNLNYRSPSENHPDLGISIKRVVKRTDPSSEWDPSALNFTHGVASGDPYPDSVILWTRIAPSAENDGSNATVTGAVPLYNHETAMYVQMSTHPVCLDYTVATDDAMEDIVNTGRVFTSSDIDYTVKVEATSLDPFTTYYYQFNVCGSSNASPIGRTKTTPLPEDDTAQVGLAVYSCSNYPFGFFNAYGNVVRKDSVDYVIHLGDYIYEYENGEYGWGDEYGRVPLPDREIYTLYDYRKRLATYRTDLDLLLSHQSYSWIPVWDDHEIADNVYRDGTAHMNNTEESFIEDGGVSVDQRKMNAVRAYFEWMPIRQVAMDDNLRIWRSFSIGNLLDIMMLDTRSYDRSVTDLYWNTDYVHEISNDASRTLMGGRQENWFYNQLKSSAQRQAVWRVIGSQIVFSRVNQSAAYGDENPLNYDAWDGYQANKNRTFQVLYENNIGNNIMLAGDSHAAWVSDLVWTGGKPYDQETGEGSVGVEFAGSAVTSPCPYGQNITLATANNYSDWLVTANEELQWNDLYYRGYYELHITREQVEARYYGMPDLTTRNPLEISLANFTVKSGENKLTRPVAGGEVESGALQRGQTAGTNLTYNTEDGTYSVL